MRAVNLPVVAGSGVNLLHEIFETSRNVLADAAAYAPGRRFVYTHQVAALFLLEMTSWPPSWKYDTESKIRLRQSMRNCVFACRTFSTNSTQIRFEMTELRPFLINGFATVRRRTRVFGLNSKDSKVITSQKKLWKIVVLDYPTDVCPGNPH